MDLFDAEPYTGLIPRGLRRALTATGLVVLTISPTARLWFLGHAERHVQHEMQPSIQQLTQPTGPGATPTSGDQ